MNTSITAHYCPGARTFRHRRHKCFIRRTRAKVTTSYPSQRPTQKRRIYHSRLFPVSRY